MRVHQVSSDTCEPYAAPRRADGYHRYGLGDRIIGDLQRERRDLAAGPAFLMDGSPAREPMQGRLHEVGAELNRCVHQAGTGDQP